MKKILLTTLAVILLSSSPAQAADCDFVPTTPNATISSVTSSTFTVTWTQAFDDTAITGYRVYLDAAIASTTAPSPRTYTHTGLLPATSYSTRIRAFDGCGNFSNFSLTKSTTTLSAPPTPPANTIRYSSARSIIAPQLSTAATLRAYISDVALSSLTASSTVVSGSVSGTQTTNDILYNTLTGSTVRQGCSSISASGTDGQGNSYPVTYGSLNSAVATANATSGAITYVSDGEAYFSAYYRGTKRAYPCTFTTTAGGTNLTFNNTAVGSLARHVTDTINTKISGYTAGATRQQMFSSSDTTNKIWVRNVNNIASTTDLTSAAVYNSSSGNQLTGVLVAPDIMIHASHAHPAVGTTMYFVSTTSATISRTISSSMSSGSFDLWVSRLSSDISSSTDGVTFAKVFQSDAFGITGSTQEGTKLTKTLLAYQSVPVVFIPQSKNLYIGNITGIDYLGMSIKGSDSLCPITNAYTSWSSAIFGGDSGTPAYMIVNNTAVALGTWSTHCQTSDISHNITAINTAMTTLGSAYQLTTVDLSSFPTY